MIVISHIEQRKKFLPLYMRFSKLCKCVLKLWGSLGPKQTTSIWERVSCYRIGESDNELRRE